MANVTEVELTVQDWLIHCTSCEARIERMLKKLPGVLTVKADHRDQKVRLTVDPEQTTAQALRVRLAAIGDDTD